MASRRPVRAGPHDSADPAGREAAREFDNGIKSGAINPDLQRKVREGTLDHLHNRFAEKF